MCGITGFLDARGGDIDRSLETVRRMTDRIRHRGPDGDGYWQSPDGMVNLGHRRLSVIDLSDAGRQPMATSDGRFVISYNGEIYNFRELRTELETAGWVFRGGSDTEVLLYALAHWGIAAVLPRLNGMFAFAIWDARERELWLVRDRFGEKPLYYAWHNQTLLFGSELKALAAHPAFRKEIDGESLAQFLRFNYVPWPLCIFKDAWKLGPGHCLCIKPGQPPGSPRPYWSMAGMVGQRELLGIDLHDTAIDEAVDQGLRRAVARRMVADVPLGVFLSGGIDSSIVTAVMQAQSSRPVKTFTIGFWESRYNEAKDAANVARHLGTEHSELYLSSRECVDTIARLPEIYDEPFADSSQIPTTLVSQFTRKHVTVALSGDAGDEMFGGYNRYAWSGRIWPKLEKLPRALRRQAASLVRSASPAKWNLLFQFANPLLPSRLQVRGGGEKLHKLATAMDAATSRELYRGLVSQWQRPADVLRACRETDFLGGHFNALPPGLGSVEEMMFLDAVTYLPSDILCKVDRASMSCGLEVRAPFLDNDLVDLAWKLPLAAKIKGGVGKTPLRRVLQRYVPMELFNRPKAGFGIPIGDWLRGPMRDWAEEALQEEALTGQGIFRGDVVRQEWETHLSGARNNQHALWSVLMFQAWYRNWFG